MSDIRFTYKTPLRRGAKFRKGSYKPSSVSSGHLSGTPVSRRLMRPTRGSITRRATTLPLFGLAPGGVCRAPAVTRSGGGLLPHRFTLTCGLSRRRSVLCGTFHRLSPPGCYPAPCPLELGLSSNRTLYGAGPRPSAPLTAPEYHGRPLRRSRPRAARLDFPVVSAETSRHPGRGTG